MPWILTRMSSTFLSADGFWFRQHVESIASTLRNRERGLSWTYVLPSEKTCDLCSEIPDAGKEI